MASNNVFSSLFTNYANFKGRAGRKEYWLTYLVVQLINVPFVTAFVVLTALSGLDLNDSKALTEAILTFNLPIGALVAFILMLLVALALVLPMLAVTVRRLHDTGRSGWWYLLNLLPYVGTLILVVQYCWPGQKYENRYGAQVK